MINVFKNAIKIASSIVTNCTYRDQYTCILQVNEIIDKSKCNIRCCLVSFTIIYELLENKEHNEQINKNKITTSMTMI